MPKLRLVLDEESPIGDTSTDTRVSPDGSTIVDRWANEPRSLLALAVALEHLVGPEPDPYLGPSAELDAWFNRYRRAGQILAEVANMDARLLRSLAGPPWDGDGPRPPGTGLLVAAAGRIETWR